MAVKLKSSTPDKSSHGLPGTGTEFRRPRCVTICGDKHEMITFQLVDCRKRLARIGTDCIYPIHLFWIGRSIQNEGSFKQQLAVGCMDGEAVATEGYHTTRRTEIVWRVCNAINLQRHLFPPTLKRFQITLGWGVHSDGWFGARFFHL